MVRNNQSRCIKRLTSIVLSICLILSLMTSLSFADQKKIANVAETLEKHDYHISVGIAVADAGEKMKELVRSAEARMFIDKRAFYEAHDRRMR